MYSRQLNLNYRYRNGNTLCTAILSPSDLLLLPKKFKQPGQRNFMCFKCKLVFTFLAPRNQFKGPCLLIYMVKTVKPFLHSFHHSELFYFSY